MQLKRIHYVSNHTGFLKTLVQRSCTYWWCMIPSKQNVMLRNKNVANVEYVSLVRPTLNQCLLLWRDMSRGAIAYRVVLRLLARELVVVGPPRTRWTVNGIAQRTLLDCSTHVIDRPRRLRRHVSTTTALHIFVVVGSRLTVDCLYATDPCINM